MDLSFLQKEGILGGFLILSLTLNAYLFHKYDSEKDKRAEDGKLYMNATLGPLRDVISVIENIQKSLDIQSKVLEITKQKP